MAAGRGTAFDVLNWVFGTSGAGDIVMKPIWVGFEGPLRVGIPELWEAAKGHPDEDIEGDAAPREARASAVSDV